MSDNNYIPPNPLADLLAGLANMAGGARQMNNPSDDTNENNVEPEMDWQDNPWVQWARHQGHGPRRGGRGRPSPPWATQPGFPFRPHHRAAHSPPHDGPARPPSPHGHHAPPHHPPHPPHGHHAPPPPHHPPHPPHAPHGHHSPSPPHPPPPPHGDHPAPPPPPPPGAPRHHSPGRHPRHHQQPWDSYNDGFGGPPAWLNNLGEFIASQLDLRGENSNTSNNNNNTTTTATKASTSAFHDFVPDADVFNTEASYVVHFSLAGAKKEDLNVNWDVEKNELVVSGVIYRPGEEDFLKTLALNERKIGAFERRVKLGDGPAAIEVDGITAKMEDGVLRVTLPKQEKDDFVEVHHVDVD